MAEYLVELTYLSKVDAAFAEANDDEVPLRSMAVFVSAHDEKVALEWGGEIASRLCDLVNDGEGLRWSEGGGECRILADPSESDWGEVLPFVQHVRAGEHPDYERMTQEAYLQWVEDNAPPCWAFEVTIRLRDLSKAEHNAFWDAFIAEAIEANNLSYGGLEDGFAEADDVLVAEAGRVFVEAWLRSRPEPIRFDVGPVLEG